MDSYLIARLANDAQQAGGCASALDGAIGAAIGPAHCADRTGGARGPEPRQPSPFCHDGTERRIQRPKDAAQQKSHDSGKKKCHTVKNVVLVDSLTSSGLFRMLVSGSFHGDSTAGLAARVMIFGCFACKWLGARGSISSSTPLFADC